MLNAKARYFAVLLAAVLALPSAPALSQEINPLIRERITVGQAPMSVSSDRRPVRVQVGINFFLPGPTNDTEESAKIRDRARRAVYEMAGRECVLLQETIAAECRLESVTVNLNRQMQQMGQAGAVEGFLANGQLGFQIMLK